MKPRPLYLATLLLTACERPAPPVVRPAPPIAVQTVALQKGDIQRWLTRPAQVRPLQQAILYARISGYLKSLAVDEGDAVKAGQMLAEIEVPELEAEGAKFRAELRAAEIEFGRQSSAMKKAPDLVLTQEVDTAEARQAVARASLREHEIKTGFTRILAPFDGIITRRWVDPGAFIPAATASSNPQSSALLTLMDFSTVRIEAAVPEPDVPFVKTGNPVTLQSDTLPGGVLRARITRFAHALDEATRSMNVQIEVLNPDGRLRPGMFAEARIALEEHKAVPLVPVEALITEKLKTSVFLAMDGRAKKTTVKAGFNDGVNVEILEGIRPQDQIILSGKLSLSDGQAVAPQPRATNP